MIQRVTIENFRCFERLSLDLRPVNLVTGKNNVGKTALLEALYLHVGAHNPELPIRLAVFRRLLEAGGAVQLDTELTWGWLFRDLDTDRGAVIRSGDDGSVDRTLRLRVDRDVPVDVADIARAGATNMSLVKGLSMDYEDSSGARESARCWFDGQALRMTHAARLQATGVFLAPDLMVGQEAVDRFSRLVEMRAEGPVVEALKAIEPRLRELRVSARRSAEGVSAGIVCDLGGSRLVPLALMGGGSTWLFNLATAVAWAAGGLVLVDDVDAGLHHEALPQVWQALAQISASSGAQIVATTHGWECVRAAASAFADRPGRLGLHRLEMRPGGVVEAVSYDDESLQASVEMGLEVR